MRSADRCSMLACGSSRACLLRFSSFACLLACLIACLLDCLIDCLSLATTTGIGDSARLWVGRAGGLEGAPVAGASACPPATGRHIQPPRGRLHGVSELGRGHSLASSYRGPHITHDYDGPLLSTPTSLAPSLPPIAILQARRRWDRTHAERGRAQCRGRCGNP